MYIFLNLCVCVCVFVHAFLLEWERAEVRKLRKSPMRKEKEALKREYEEVCSALQN